MAHKQLKANDRYTINKLLDAGTNQAEIARIIGVNASTISREIKRNTATDFKGVYNHLVANKLSADRKIASKSTPALDQITEEIEAEIIEKLKKHTSPKVISGELKLKKSVLISKNAIYRYISLDRKQGGKLYLDLPHAGKPYKPKSDASSVKIPGRVGIEHRPAIADLKTEPGHWEIDTIFGYKQESFFLTLADKATKSTIIRKLPNKKAETVVEAFKYIMKTTLYDFKTLTSDNGTEFTEHARISEITGALFFFC